MLLPDNLGEIVPVFQLGTLSHLNDLLYLLET